MPLQKRPVHSLDDINQRRRDREITNQILDHSFDDSKVTTAAEKLTDTTAINKAFAPGHFWRLLTEDQRKDVQRGAQAYDLTAPFQASADLYAGNYAEAYSMFMPDGVYKIANVTINNRTRLVGGSLEGTRLEAPSGLTGVWVNDAGNAAKVEVYNLTLDGNSESGITHGLRLGVDDIQFGTYGCIDNIMVRDMPLAVGYDFDCNIVVCGKLYSFNTYDGLISRENGSGLHVESFTPYGFIGTGAQLAKGDSINFMEAEAPAADTAKPLIYKRGGTVWNYYLSIGPNRQIRTPVEIDTTFVSDWLLGVTTLNYHDSTAKYGDTTNPDDSGTATSGGATTLTDTAKTWTRDQWKGAALHLTGGTGSGQWQRVLSNSKDTLTLEGTWSGSFPDNTTTYEMSYFIRNLVGGGFGHSQTLTAYWPWFSRLSVGNQLNTNTLVVGKSNHSIPIQGIMKAVATLDFGSVAAQTVGTGLTVTVLGAQTNMPVVLGIPDGIASQGIVFTACVSAADTVKIYPKNITVGAIDLASATYVVTVFDYA
jgi:hypothetical protein